MDRRRRFARGSRLIGAAVMIIAWTTPALGQDGGSALAGYIEAISEVKVRDNVIILDPRLKDSGVPTDGAPSADNVPTSEALEEVDRVEYGDSSGAGAVVVYFYRESLDGRLVSAGVDDIVVGVDRDCDPFWRQCGLMGRLEQRRDDGSCERDPGRECVEMVFSPVGLDAVIASGAIKAHARARIHSDDTGCFRSDWPAPNENAEYDLESMAIELGCHELGNGVLPPTRDSDVPYPIAGAEVGTARVIPVAAMAELCEEAGWRRSFAYSATEPLFGELVTAQVLYSGTVALNQEIEFDSSGVRGAEITSAYCQTADLNLSVDHELYRSKPLWTRSTGRRYRMIGWVPVVYSIAARLDFSVWAAGETSMKPFVSFTAADSVSGSYERGETPWDLTSRSAQGEVQPGNASIDARATATVTPSLQLNLYGLGGPMAAADLNGAVRVDAGSGDMTPSGKLDGCLKVGLEGRLLAEPVNYAIAGGVYTTPNWASPPVVCNHDQGDPTVEHQAMAATIAYPAL